MGGKKGAELKGVETEKGKEEGKAQEINCCAVLASAVRGGLRHTHGSWFINAAFPLLVYQRND